MRKAAVIVAALVMMPFYQALGHGISFDSTPPQTYKDMNIAIFVKVEPQVISEPVDKGKITITLRDLSNNKILKDVILFIRIIKDNRILLEDKFNSPEGRIVLEIIPNDIKPKISAFWDPDEGWRASESLPATVEGPILLDGGLYHFMFEVQKVEGSKIPTNMILKYDSYVSVGEPSTFPSGNSSVTIWSMYDKITDFAYANNSINFKMPLIWDANYLARVPLIHIDVILPRELEDVISKEYDVKINGVSIPKDALRIDTSKPNFVAVHIVLLTQHIMSIIDDIDESYKIRDIAEFTVSPIKPAEEIEIAKLSTLSSDKNYKVTMSYSPSLTTDTPITFIMDFRDQRNNAVADAIFDFVISKDGKVVFRENDVSTVVGVGTVQYTFTEVGSYTISLENINGGGDADFAITVVPEFPITFLIVSIAMSLAVLIRKL